MLPHEIQALFSRKFGWHPQGDAFLVEGIVDNEMLSRVVTLDEIKLVDPRLVYALPSMLPASREVAKLYNETPLEYFPGSLIRHTLLHWDKPKYLTDADGEQRPYFELANIVDYDYQLGSKTLSVEAILYQVHDAIFSDGSKHSLVVDINYDMVDISTAWLEQEFPGWEQRMVAALSIGYQYKHLNAVVFVNDSVPGVTSLDEVRFD